jgi:hypothetical protein
MVVVGQRDVLTLYHVCTMDGMRIRLEVLVSMGRQEKAQ